MIFDVSTWLSLCPHTPNSESLAEEQLHGLLSEIIKESIFSGGQFS